MAHIRPFKGICYNPAKISNIAKVVAPPYDMISPEEQKVLYERDAYNFVRLILGYQHPGDTDKDNRYTRSAATLNDWLEGGILVRDPVPAVYVYEQEYALARGPRLTRRGFIALLRLEDLGQDSIYPHERTMSGPKEDRLKLLTACRANLSQIFAFYDDPGGETERILTAAAATPRFDLTDGSGVRHVLSPVTDAAAIVEVSRLMEDKKLFIADGHHRYETALAFRDVMVRTLGPDCPEGYDHVMMYFTNMASPGMTILPFHRLVLPPAPFGPEAVIARLRNLGELTQLPNDGDRRQTVGSMLKTMSRSSREDHRYGVYVPPSFYLFSYRRAAAAGRGAGDLMENLDVSVLHNIILEELLEGSANQAEIGYLTDEEAILDKVDAGAYQMAFFLNATRVGQVRDIAAAGLRMPPKSTNFHPKLISGLVFNLLEG